MNKRNCICGNRLDGAAQFGVCSKCYKRTVNEIQANMVKSVDTPDLKSDGEIHPGSIPGVGTRLPKWVERMDLKEREELQQMLNKAYMKGSADAHEAYRHLASEDD